KANDPNVSIVMAEVVQRFGRLPEGEKLPPVIEAAAHARFLNLETSFNDFMGIHFNYTRQSDLVYVLKIKNVRITRLLEAYGEVHKPALLDSELTRAVAPDLGAGSGGY